MPKIYMIALVWMMSIFVTHGAPVEVKNPHFLDNGVVKIGVNMDSGGAIFWFSRSPENKNLLNHYDRGRYIQQSYYGKSDGSKWVDKPWRWNPVQGGDYKGKAARVIEKKLDRTSLHIVSTPVHWASGDELSDCKMEQWIHIEGEIAHIRFRFSYNGKVSHTPQHQEMPAVFVDAALPKLHYYHGDAPWTDKPTQHEIPGWPNKSCQADEEWAAYTDEQDTGVGVFFSRFKKTHMLPLSWPNRSTRLRM